MPLAQDRNTPYRDAEIISIPVAAGAVIYAGALIVTNAAGFAAPGSVATTLTYAGRADQAIDNTGGANGDKTVTVRRGVAFKFLNSGADPVTQASQGKVCYVVDDQTVAATNGAATRSAAGVVIGLDSDGVWVL